jgi:cytidylate kinase
VVPELRAALVDLQRSFGAPAWWRTAGTWGVIFPEAGLKIFSASAGERAERRHQHSNHRDDQPCGPFTDISRRDQRDASRRGAASADSRRAPSIASRSGRGQQHSGARAARLIQR